MSDTTDRKKSEHYEDDKEALLNIIGNLADGDTVELEEFSDNDEDATQADRLAEWLRDISDAINAGKI